MQSNGLRVDSGAWRGKKIGFLLKLAVLALLVAYIARHLYRQPVALPLLWQQLQTGIGAPAWLAVLVGLMPVNWGLEARKWQRLARRIEPVSFGEAYRGVLAGVTLGFALPIVAGDAAGRVLSLQTNRRAGAVGASLVSGGLQFLAALLAGTLAWACHLFAIPARNHPMGWVLFGLLCLVLLLSLLAAGSRQRLQTWLTQWAGLNRYGLSARWRQKLHPYWRIAADYTATDLSIAFGLALLRHLTFSLQFYAALRLYGIHLAAGPLFIGIGLVFLAKTITPAFTFLSDLGVREAAALWVFAPYHLPAPLLVSATFTLWLTNVLAPVLVGIVAVWRLRLTTR